MSLPLNIDWQQILLHLFNFILLGTGLYLLLYKPVKIFMDQRTAYYKEMDERAHAQLAQAEALQADYTRKLDTVQQEIDAQRKAANDKIAAARQAVLDDAKAESQRLLDKTRAQAEAERQRLLADSRAEVTELALEAAGKLAGETMTDQRQKSLLDDILQKVGESRGC